MFPAPHLLLKLSQTNALCLLLSTAHLLFYQTQVPIHPPAFSMRENDIQKYPSTLRLSQTKTLFFLPAFPAQILFHLVHVPYIFFLSM